MTETQKGIELNEEQRRKYRINCVLTMLGIVVAQFVVMFNRNSSGILESSLKDAFNLTTMQYALFSSLYFYPYVVMQLVMGILADTIGPRKAISAGMLLTAIGTIMFSLAQSYTVICISRVLIGIGVSGPITCGSKLYASWFKQKNVATASGVVSLVCGVLSFLGQTPLALAVGYFGWRNTYVTAAVGTVAIAALCFFAMKDDPKKVGLPSIAEMEGVVRPPKPKQNIAKTVLSVYKNKWTLPFLIIMPIQMGVYTMFSSTWAIPYISQVFNKTTVEASTYMIYMILGTSISAFVITFLSDKIRNRKIPLHILNIVQLVCWVAITFFSPALQRTNTLWLVMFGVGFTQGFVPLAFAMLREINHPDNAGIAVGSCNMIGMSGSAILPVVIGAIVSKYENLGLAGFDLFRNSFKLCVILAVICLIVGFFTKETHCENIYAQEK